MKKRVWKVKGSGCRSRQFVTESDRTSSPDSSDSASCIAPTSSYIVGCYELVVVVVVVVGSRDFNLGSGTGIWANTNTTLWTNDSRSGSSNP